MTLTHADAQGAAHMVDIAHKPATTRRAKAVARVKLSEAARQALAHHLPKGDAFAVARIAGIQAAKRASELIPLCHGIALSKCAVVLELRAEGVVIEAEAVTVAATGVEMEALTAASVAALTVYDMLKAVDRGIVIEQVRLLEKSGGAHDMAAPAE